MRLNEYLKNLRIKKGLNDKDFAEIVGRNIHWVEDFDSDEEELNGLNILQFKKMCSTLGVAPQEIYNSVTLNLKNLSISELLKKRRKEKYWTKYDLADRIGYDPLVIDALENNINLNEVCMDALKKVAIELDLPFDILLLKL